jgi:hypothetical protein
VEHPGVVDLVDERSQTAQRTIPVAAAHQQDAPVDLEVVGVGPEAALLGEPQAVPHALLELVEPAGPQEQLGQVAVPARGVLVAAFAHRRGDALPQQRQAVRVAELEACDAEVAEG